MDLTEPLPLVILDPQVRATAFACDLEVCKGACCTLPGGSGPVVTPGEAQTLREMLPVLLPRLEPAARTLIALEGISVEIAGELTLRCVNDRACVFVEDRGGVAHCAVEAAWHAGQSALRKPLSCHLFPIRRATGTFDHLYVEHLPACDSGYRRGRREAIPLTSFTRAALARAYGDAWVAEVVEGGA